jgi:hypothetical protein
MNYCPPTITPFVSAGVSLVGIIVGVLIGIFAEPIRGRIFRPVLVASFDEHDEGCNAHTTINGDPPSEGYYIRAKVVNSKHRLAKSCRAFLVNVEQRTARGDFVRTTPKYDDSLALDWSAQFKDGNPPIDLPFGISQFVDIVSTNRLSKDFKLHALLPNRYGNLIDNKPKVLRFTILVTGDDVVPGTLKVIFDWRGQWNTFEIAKA